MSSTSATRVDVLHPGELGVRADLPGDAHPVVDAPRETCAVLRPARAAADAGRPARWHGDAEPGTAHGRRATYRGRNGVRQGTTVCGWPRPLRPKALPSGR
jgi:hypothetical protein